MTPVGQYLEGLGRVVRGSTGVVPDIEDLGLAGAASAFERTDLE